MSTLVMFVRTPHWRVQQITHPGGQPSGTTGNVPGSGVPGSGPQSRSSGGFPLSPPANSRKELAWAAARAALASVATPSDGDVTVREALEPQTLAPRDLDAVEKDAFASPPSESASRTHEWVQVWKGDVVVDLKQVRIDPPRRSYDTGPITCADDPSASRPLLPRSSAPVEGGGSPEPGESDKAPGSDKDEDSFSTGQPEAVGSITLEPPEYRHHRIIFDWRNDSESSVHSSLVIRKRQGPGPPRDY